MKTGNSSWFRLFYFGLLLALVAVGYVAQQGYAEPPRWLVLSLLMTWILSHLPMILLEVRDGTITIGPQLVFRHQRPVFFWIVVVTQVLAIVFVAVLIVGGMRG